MTTSEEAQTRHGGAPTTPPEPLNAATTPSVRCPFCGSEETEPMALFGAHLLFEQQYCRACHTPFERIVDTKG